MSAFLERINQIAARVGTTPENLLLVIDAESGFKPNEPGRPIKGKTDTGKRAMGLIQFIPSTAKGLGTSTEALAKMSALQQLDYVEKYLMDIKTRYKMDGFTLKQLYASIYAGTPHAKGNASDKYSTLDQKVAEMEAKRKAGGVKVPSWVDSGEPPTTTAKAPSKWKDIYLERPLESPTATNPEPAKQDKIGALFAQSGRPFLQLEKNELFNQYAMPEPISEEERLKQNAEIMEKAKRAAWEIAYPDKPYPEGGIDFIEEAKKELKAPKPAREKTLDMESFRQKGLKWKKQVDEMYQKGRR